jgi:hypothetical protein
LMVHRGTSHESALSAAPAVLVLDAFNGGGNQAALRQDSTISEMSLKEILSSVQDHETLRGGIQLNLASRTEQRLANEGGTFTFGAVVDPSGRVIATPLENYQRTLQGLPGYGPSTFSIAHGDPVIGFRDWQLSTFIQDDVQHGNTVTYSLGLRHDMQKYARLWLLDFAPRGGIAWAPGGSGTHIFRTAAGLFYSMVPPEVTLDPIRYNGVNTVQLVVDHPTFFPAIPATFDSTTALSSVRLNQRVYAPMTMATTSSYEWQATKTLSASVAFTYQRGYRLLRTLNINSPNPSTLLRPYANLGPVLKFDSSGQSDARELRVALRRSLTRLSLFGTYSLRFSNSSTDNLYTTAADFRTLQGEYGRAADDQRHQVVFGSVVSLSHDWSFSSLLTLGSGRPFNITTGFDNNGDLVFEDRPSIGIPGAPGVVTTPIGNFDVHPASGQPTIARNAGQGPSEVTLNAGLAKTLRFGGDAHPSGTQRYVVFSVNGLNLTNRVNYTQFNGVVTSPLFGTANRAQDARRFELSARIGF